MGINVLHNKYFLLNLTTLTHLNPQYICNINHVNKDIAVRMINHQYIF